MESIQNLYGRSVRYIQKHIQSGEQRLALKISLIFFGIFLGLFVLFLLLNAAAIAERQRSAFRERANTFAAHPELIADFSMRLRSGTLFMMRNHPNGTTKDGSGRRLPDTTQNPPAGDLPMMGDGSDAPPIPRGLANAIVVFGGTTIFVRGSLENVPTNQLPLDITAGSIEERVVDERPIMITRLSIPGIELYLYDDSILSRVFRLDTIFAGLAVLGLAALMLYGISWRVARAAMVPLHQSMRRLTEYNRHLAHEVKTPLAVLRSNLELARMGISPDSAIVSSFEEVGTLERIVDTLLFLSERGDMARREVVDIAEIAESVRDSLATIYPGNAIRITTTETSTKTVSADPDLLRAYIKNLVENACKYSPQGGMIGLRLERWGFIVENTGRTLTGDEVTHVFDPFYKVAGDEAPGGFGLGLSIVKRIADLHGWQVSFVSEDGQNQVRTTYIV